MQQRTVLLIRSDDLGWTDLRTSLQAMRNAHLVGEVTDAREALQLAAAYQPDIILAGGTIAGESAVPLLVNLRRNVTPISTIVVFAAHLNPAELVTLVDANITNYLLWSDLSATTLHHYLTIVLAGNFVVSSQAMVEAMLMAQRQRLRPKEELVPLTIREQAVLKHLAQGLTREKIAEVEHISLRTVKRTISTLEEKLEAPCQFVLGLKTAQIGLIS
jgi:two-component system nitrate/nitrite response regulator NarL